MDGGTKHKYKKSVHEFFCSEQNFKRRKTSKKSARRKNLKINYSSPVLVRKKKSIKNVHENLFYYKNVIEKSKKRYFGTFEQKYKNELFIHQELRTPFLVCVDFSDFGHFCDNYIK